MANMKEPLKFSFSKFTMRKMQIKPRKENGTTPDGVW